MGKLIDSDDLIMVIKMFGGMGDVATEEISSVTETVKLLIQATPEAKVEAEPKEQEEKSVMWKDAKTAGDVLIFACGNCGADHHDKENQGVLEVSVLRHEKQVPAECGC